MRTGLSQICPDIEERLPALPTPVRLYDSPPKKCASPIVMMYSNDHQIEALQAFAGLWIAAIACFVVVTVLRIAFVCSGLAKMSTDHS
jgi:hypothetical protein